MMPAASIDGEPWQIESADLLRELGYATVSREELQALHDAWRGVTHRAHSARRFFCAASLIHDPHPSHLRRVRNQFLRSFSVLYFYLLLRWVIQTGLQPDPLRFGEQFHYWEQRLEKSAGAYLCGDRPNTLDMMLFGVVQCHCSMPAAPLDALQTDPGLPRLRSWIKTMQQRFTGYPHLYSGVYFEPYSAQPGCSTGPEQAAYWVGLALMILATPITLPLIIFLATRLRRDQPNT